MRKFAVRVLACLTLLLVLGGLAHANTAITLNSYGPFTNGAWSLGFEFTPTVDIDVTSLGSWFPGGAVDTHGITLWDLGQNVLATTTVNGNGVEGFVYGAISPVLLTGGTTYVIAATTLSDNYAVTEDVLVDPYITYIDHVEVPCGGVTPCFPTNHWSGYVDFGANFQFTPVPEPGTLLLLGSGLVVGVGAVRRRINL